MTIIKGVGFYNPKIISNEAFIKNYGIKAKAVSRFIKHKEHFAASDPVTGELFCTNLDMAEKAAIEAIKSAGITNEDIDMIIYSSFTPDYQLPPSFALIQERLKIKRCMGMDIRSGCAGFGTALTIADTYISAKKAKNILIIGSDVVSTRFSRLHVKDPSLKHVFNHMFFGDSAGAFVFSQGPSDKGIVYSEMASTKADAGYGSIVFVGGCLYPYSSEDVNDSQWGLHQVADMSEKYLPEVLIEELEKVNESVPLKDIDVFIMPIESEKIKSDVLKACPDISEEKIFTGSEYGALVNAAVPYALHKAISSGAIKSGKRVLIYAAENTKWQHALLVVNWQ